MANGDDKLGICKNHSGVCRDIVALDERTKEQKDNISDAHARIDNNVTLRTFYFITGLIVTVLLSAFAMNYRLFREIDHNMVRMAADVGHLHAEVPELKKKMEEHKKENSLSHARFERILTGHISKKKHNPDQDEDERWNSR